jgi:hypothetical protein
MEAGSLTTANHLTNYIPDVLEAYKLDAMYCAHSLEFTFGEKIHKQIDGFIRFAKDQGLEEHDIKATLCHDIGGGLNNDKMMLPRVSDYGSYTGDEVYDLLDDEEEEQEEMEDTTWDFWEEE